MITEKIYQAIILGLAALVFIVSGLLIWKVIQIKDLEKDVATEKLTSEQLRSAITESNTKIQQLGKEKDAAEAKFAQASKIAEANGVRFDKTLSALRNQKQPVTCEEAIPSLDRALAEANK